MQGKPVLIIHGWSDKSDSFEPLAGFLKSNGFEVVNIFLGDYMSMYDEVTINDLGEAMGKAIKANNIPQAPREFDVIVHSTGGLVVRQYLYHYYYAQPELCPIDHLVMLAPCNFGSPLASLGQSVLGRMFKGWKWDGMFQTGKLVLDALKFASPISWNMALNDLFDPANKIFCPDNLYTTILIGSDSYEGIASIKHQNGSDGVVRVATANLNARYLRLKFTTETDLPEIVEVLPCYDTIAFGVLYEKNHSSIKTPSDTSYNSLGDLIIRSLRIDSPDKYRQHIDNLRQITAQTFQQGIITAEEKYHQYQHLVTCVHDQFGEQIHDYVIEFFQEDEDDSDIVMQKVHGEILEKVDKFEHRSGFTSFFFDITDMRLQILNAGHRVQMSLSAAALSKNITYLDPKMYLTVVGPTESEQYLLCENTPILVDIELPRIQSGEVFSLRIS